MSGEDPRQPHDLQGLLKFALEATVREDAPNTSSLPPLDEERRQWLEEALSVMTADPIDELLKAILTLRGPAVLRPDEDPMMQEEALETITHYAESIDIANDFLKVGGLAVVVPCLTSPHSSLRWRAADLIAVLTQNNPYCQDGVLAKGLMPMFLKMLDSDSCKQTRVKSLYALSCLTRDNAVSWQQFSELDGFSVLVRAMQSNIEKLKIKASFMLTHLCRQEPALRDTLCQMGFIDQLASMIQEEHDPSHEHFLSALVSLVTEHEGAIRECQRPELQLRDMLMKRIEDLEGKAEFNEEVNYCHQLLSLCFSSETEEDR